MIRASVQPEYTRDTFYRGRVVIFQERRGYRFSLDAPLLADFLPVCSGPALEVGCGCGVVALLALHRAQLGKIAPGSWIVRHLQIQRRK